jgi:copper chaperone CopZ
VTTLFSSCSSFSPIISSYFSSFFFAVSYQVEGPLSVFQDLQQLETTRRGVLAMTGVNNCEVAAGGQSFTVSFHGDTNMAHHISLTIGQTLGGLTVNHDDNVSTFFLVDGMTCGSCTETVRRAASAVDGVLFCDVYLKRALCGVVTSRTSANSEAVIAAIEAVGFDAKAAVASRVLSLA